MSSQFKAGEWAEVRSADEILATLDDNGALENLPFQPEFLQYCGKRYRVFRTAHRTCDTLYWGPGRDTASAVYLDLRCDGAAHDGCQAECLILWKDAWLKPVADGPAVAAQPLRDAASTPPQRTGERGREWLQAKTRYADPASGETRYRCQATEHVRASQPVKGFDVRNYWRDVSSGNTSVSQLAKGSLLLAVWRLRFLPFGWRIWVALYAALHRALYKQPDPHITGKIPLGTPTPAVALNLKVGEYARVRSLPEIAGTLNTANQNRGLKFNPELAVFCGHAGRVTSRVERIVDEKTGKMLHFRNPCIILENTYCQARYVPQALHCPRRSLQYYREAWLERVEPPAASNGRPQS